MEGLYYMNNLDICKDIISNPDEKEWNPYLIVEKCDIMDINNG
jgi:hypothetical protein|tara:strand:- start:195 stop:323 length:129 start_codon:yes stop_codon:yes gene_type:complete